MPNQREVSMRLIGLAVVLAVILLGPLATLAQPAGKVYRIGVVGAAPESPEQEQLAEEAGLSRGYVARLETGRHDPAATTLAKIAKALRVPIARLFT